MRIFKTKWLVRFARRARITDKNRGEAIDRAARGLIDADLGGGIIKQRVARQGRGRSGGYRMLSPTEPVLAPCFSTRSPKTSARTLIRTNC